MLKEKDLRLRREVLGSRARGLRVRSRERLLHSSLAGLVVLAGGLYPIPSRTRPLNSPAPMVLSLKTWKSRSLPGLPRTKSPHHDDRLQKTAAGKPAAVFFVEKRIANCEWRMANRNPTRHSHYLFFACRADQSAAMRRRNAFGFSANSLPASRAAVLRCAARRASITGASRDRHGASG